MRSRIGKLVYRSLERMGEARATLETADGAKLPCLCGTLSRARIVDDSGMAIDPMIDIRILEGADRKAGESLAIGKVVTLERGGERMRLRIRGRHVTAGVIRYEMGSDV
jgi:hypothetical protein